MTKNKNKEPEKEPVAPIEAPEAPEEELTLEEVEREQEEVQILKDTLEVEPKDLTDEQKEIIRKNKDKLPEEQKEFYKDILEEQAEPSKEVKEKLKQEVEEKKKKLAASARENQKIYAKNRVINKALVEAEETPEPTEEELVKEFPDWEVMSETEKTFAKETVISRNWRRKISEAKEQATKIEKWNDSVDEFIGDPQTMLDNPELEGKQESFSDFAKQEANNNVPFNILIGAFLHEQSKEKRPHKGRMFESGSGGPNNKPTPKTDKISLEDARKLRETNYSKYKEYLLAGKIESDL